MKLVDLAGVISRYTFGCVVHSNALLWCGGGSATTGCCSPAVVHPPVPAPSPSSSMRRLARWAKSLRVVLRSLSECASVHAAEPGSSLCRNQMWKALNCRLSCCWAVGCLDRDRISRSQKRAFKTQN